MNAIGDALFDRARELSESDRAELAAKLLDTLEDEADADVDESWQEEIRLRLADVDSAKAKTVSNTEAFRLICGEQ